MSDVFTSERLPLIRALRAIGLGGIHHLKNDRGDYGVCNDAADEIEAKDKRIEELEEANAKLFCHLADAKNALKIHHRWHLDCDELDSYAVPDGEGGWIGLNRAEEYADSEMHDITDAILSKGDT